MKKKIAWLLVIAAFAALFAGCSKKEMSKNIQAQAFQTGAVISLPLKAELNEGDFVSYGGYQFQSKKKLSKMAKMIRKEQKSLTATSFKNAYGECWLFTQEMPGGTDSWCLYELDRANAKNRFIFSGMHRELQLEKENLDILLPLHLISDAYIRDNMGSRLQPGIEYACGVKNADSTMAAMFHSFYQSSGLYKVAASGEGFIVTPNTPGSTLQLLFSFTEHDDAQWFAISDITEYEPEPVSEMQVVWTADDDEEPIVVDISGDDSLQLSALLIGLNYKASAADVEYPYTADLDGERYRVRLIWEDSMWNGTAEYNGKTATLNSKVASLVASLLAVNDLMSVESTESPIHSEVIRQVGCMATTADLNVRDEPKDGEVLEILPEDSAVAIIGKIDEWQQILFGEQIAYVSGDYLRSVTD